MRANPMSGRRMSTRPIDSQRLSGERDWKTSRRPVDGGFKLTGYGRSPAAVTNLTRFVAGCMLIEGSARRTGATALASQPPEEACEFIWDGVNPSAAYFDCQPAGSFRVSSWGAGPTGVPACSGPAGLP